MIIWLFGFGILYLVNSSSNQLAKELEYHEKQIQRWEQLAIDLSNPKLFNPNFNDCIEWGQKHFTKSIQDVNGIECPRIIHDSYQNDYDYDCEVCIKWISKWISHSETTPQKSG